MQTALAAYHNLCALARADGELSDGEREVLERYRLALGITAEHLAAEVVADDLRLVAHERITGSPQECAHAVQMMARVGYADGALSAREELLLTNVAESLGIGRLQFADILVGVEAEHVRRRRMHRGLWVVGSTLAAGLLAVGLIDAFERPVAARIDARQLAEAKAAAERITASWAALQEREAELARRVAQLQVRSPAEHPAGMAAELAELKQQLARVNAARTGFKEIERQTRDAVLLIVVRYIMQRGSERVRQWSSGTGFFLSPDGLLVTNKHVLQPWKFISEIVQQVADGWTVDEASIEILAWRHGEVVQREDGGWDTSTSYSNADDTLAVVHLPPDKMEWRTYRSADGSVARARYHASDNADLAILRARVLRPVPHLTLATDTAVEKLDPVMVVGFPTGTQILEGRRAESSPSVGVVRKVEDTILITAPIVGGNSGGPVLDAEGRVIGVATRTHGDATLGACIRAVHVRSLEPFDERPTQARKKVPR